MKECSLIEGLQLIWSWSHVQEGRYLSFISFCFLMYWVTSGEQKDSLFGVVNKTKTVRGFFCFVLSTTVS